jgi:hypothetical protein
MKNGDARSQAWIARNLRGYKRDDQVVQTLLGLVDAHPIPSLFEIGTWTPEQCLLAEDWARAVHFSASDNNNRVPARPAFLVPYSRTYPGRTPRAAAIDAVRAMGDDNGACFHPTASQWASLEDGIREMMNSCDDVMGCPCYFTDAQILLFAAGESTEMEEHFKQYKGYEKAQLAMLQIFDELDDEGTAGGMAGVRSHEPAMETSR